MANNYLQFSEAIKNLTAEEKSWLERQLETICVIGDKEYAESEAPDDLSTGEETWLGCRALRDFPDVDSDDDTGFQHKFLEDEELGQYLWLYAEEGGVPEHVAHLVHKFLRQFRPKESWSLTYATTCSKPRLGEFGGGAVFVTAGGVEAFDAEDFIGDRRAAFGA